jgi:hypothetical protein
LHCHHHSTTKTLLLSCMPTTGTTGVGSGEEALHASRPPPLPHPRSTPEPELHAPPTSPEAMARTGPQKPISGLTTMHDHGHRKLSTRSSLDPVPSTPPPRALPEPPHAAAPSRTAAAQANVPHEETSRERGPAPVVGGASGTAYRRRSTNML